MAKKPGGLGKGFDALLPSNFDTSMLVSEGEKIQKVALDDVVPNPDQPRREFDQEALAGLADSIKRYGVLQPLVVAPADNNGKYEIIAGERRWRASNLAGSKLIPVIVRSGQEHERLELALIENIQRVDLSPLEQAASIERLRLQFNLVDAEIAKRLGKAVSTISNIVRLLQLPPAAAKALAEKQITEGHARQILSLRNEPELAEELLMFIVNNGWSVRQAERYVTSIKEGHRKTADDAKARVDTETPASAALAQRLNTKVAIKRMAKGGRLEISFKTDDELNKILASL